MATLPGELPATVTPTPEDALLAQESSRRLTRLLGAKGSVRLRVQPDEEGEETVSIPLSAFRLLTDVLAEMAKGNAMALMPVHAELTTQQAADLINVSRPFLIEQLEKGVIPFRKVGKHRRVQFQDLMAYKQTMDRNRLGALDELASQAQQLGMGY